MANSGLLCHPHSAGWFKCKSHLAIQTVHTLQLTLQMEHGSSMLRFHDTVPPFFYPESFLFVKYILPQKTYKVKQELLIFTKSISYHNAQQLVIHAPVSQVFSSTHLRVYAINFRHAIEQVSMDLVPILMVRFCGSSNSMQWSSYGISCSSNSGKIQYPRFLLTIAIAA